jgi:hypothetical protein
LHALKDIKERAVIVDESQTRAERIRKLLAQLNELERLYGRVPAQADPRYEPTGEVNARVKVLMTELAQLGVTLRWDGKRYVIEGGGDAGPEA